MNANSANRWTKLVLLTILGWAAIATTAVAQPRIVRRTCVVVAMAVGCPSAVGVSMHRWVVSAAWGDSSSTCHCSMGSALVFAESAPPRGHLRPHCPYDPSPERKRVGPNARGLHSKTPRLRLGALKTHRRLCDEPSDNLPETLTGRHWQGAPVLL